MKRTQRETKKKEREREGGSKRCVDGAGCVMSEKTHQMTER